MTVLLFAVVLLLLFAMFLSYRVDELTFEKKLVQIDADMYKSIYENEKEYTELYWLHYLEEQSKNRSKALLIKELQEEVSELESKVDSLTKELANESEWAMEYAESVDKYGALYLEALKMADELEAKNEHLKLELEYYRQKFDGDYDPIE